MSEELEGNESALELAEDDIASEAGPGVADEELAEAPVEDGEDDADDDEDE